MTFFKLSKPTPSPTSTQATKTTPTQNYEDLPNNSIFIYTICKELLSHKDIRIVIAKRLTEAKSQIPHLYVTAECNIDQLLAIRAKVNSMYYLSSVLILMLPLGAQSVKVSVNDFVLKAAALALRDVPAANATWTNGTIRLLSYALP